GARPPDGSRLRLAPRHADLAIAPDLRSRSKSELAKPQSRKASSVCSPDVAALHDLAPFVARPGAKQRLQPLLHRGPRIAIMLIRQLLTLESRQAEQFLVELCFDRSDRNVLAVPGFVNLVEMSARIEEVVAAFVVPYTPAVQTVDRGHQ